MNVAITGTSRGLGDFLYRHWAKKNHYIKTFNRGEDLFQFIEEVKNFDLLINNSYLDGDQNLLFDRTIETVKKTVVMGSVAADYPDPLLPVYSKDKKILQKEIICMNSCKVLYLKLTGKSYKNYQMIAEIIDIWVENPVIKNIEFHTEIPNE